MKNYGTFAFVLTQTVLQKATFMANLTDSTLKRVASGRGHDETEFITAFEDNEEWAVTEVGSFLANQYKEWEDSEVLSGPDAKFEHVPEENDAR